jgi:hypothetical protein
MVERSIFCEPRDEKPTKQIKTIQSKSTQKPFINRYLLFGLGWYFDIGQN